MGFFWLSPFRQSVKVSFPLLRNAFLVGHRLRHFAGLLGIWMKGMVGFDRMLVCWRTVVLLE
jgi:hypothetical protein